MAGEKGSKHFTLRRNESRLLALNETLCLLWTITASRTSGKLWSSSRSFEKRNSWVSSIENFKLQTFLHRPSTEQKFKSLSRENIAASNHKQISSVVPQINSLMIYQQEIILFPASSVLLFLKIFFSLKFHVSDVQRIFSSHDEESHCSRNKTPTTVS